MSDSGGASVAAARALVLRALGFHARTEAQLRARLARAGHAAQADAAIAWARDLGYVDDAAYARGRARQLLAGGRSGPRRAELKLAAEGVERRLAREAVQAAVRELAAELPDPPGQGDELSLCRLAAARKLAGADPPLPSRAASALLREGRRPSLPPDARARAKLARFLLGRGFSADVVGRVVPVDDDE